ncbi:glycoside hydrolase family 2 TIM barrel-domain containing protein [Sphingobacterium gobiense]|uniref:Glycoside hydrolase family 2 n=1 Tax=Sphingobacterium gobiense TaxID=1382456 RepID=A0A2S9JCY3_9SPHI|nr:glycoside hydrolase family 2 TIM barrel-domain containing protein [Sphingobacterium gobiense]PRD50710.1 glycoside hydrolase family 2 [Sphingobacterium gobiense]
MRVVFSLCVNRNLVLLGWLLFVFLGNSLIYAQSRKTVDFNTDWSFRLDSTSDYRNSAIEFTDWRKLDLPHDWSIELPFDSLSAGSSGTGYLSGGVGWYKKKFALSQSENAKRVYVEFGGIYENSEVWINDVYLGRRPNGYVPILYDLTAHVHKDGEPNVMTVKVDNSKQPNSRFYAGSGIYRNVKLIFTDEVAIAHHGTFYTTPVVEKGKAIVNARFEIIHHTSTLPNAISIETQIHDPTGRVVAKKMMQGIQFDGMKIGTVVQEFEIAAPRLWSPDHPELYRGVTVLRHGTRELDRYETVFGIRSFGFDAKYGFSINGAPMKIRGVCLHSDLGALGMAFNRSAARRQLQTMKNMGVNGIRTSHNPAASEFLDLCDEMGFIVMNETFDVWKHHKNPFDYHLYWDAWHERDFADHIKRDRNHPSLFVWCMGNEAQEQWHDPALGKSIPRRLAAIVDSLDGTRPTTIASNEMSLDNPVLMSTAVDLIGYNYNHRKWSTFPEDHPGRKFIVTESTSALASRGQYDLVPIDAMRIWPLRWDIPFDGGNPDKSISAYDHVHTPWGSTHEESLRLFEAYPHISGMYVWTGFDYLGEPTPYTWPARSSYFGIVDLAGFPKDVYYLYQSIWTEKDVLHLLPHWNWQNGDTVDVVAYYNNADEVELFVNGMSKGRRKKEEDKLHVRWTVPYQAGSLTVVAYRDGIEMRRTIRQTAGEAVRLVIKNMQDTIDAGNYELAFLEVVAVDVEGNEVPYFNDWVEVETKVGGTVVATDNGNPTDLTSFQSSKRKAYNGKLLAIVKSNKGDDKITVAVHAKGLKSASRQLVVK